MEGTQSSNHPNVSTEIFLIIVFGAFEQVENGCQLCVTEVGIEKERNDIPRGIRDAIDVWLAGSNVKQ
jgi:hypothetical protein